MPFSLRKLTKLQFIAFCLMVLLGLSAFAFSWRDWLPKSNPSKPALAVVQTTPPLVITGALVQELITLRPTGFDPAEITIPSGQFLLSVDNLTTLDAINLTLDEVKKNRLKEVKVDKKDRYWRDVTDLKQGDYLLSEATHPGWTCKITVTNKVRTK